MSHTGRCLCGAVTVTAREVDQDAHVCHCSMCRRWSGGPALAVNASGVEFEGEESLERYDSSDWAQRGFCRRCGTNLFYYLKPADQYVLWMGMLDDVDRYRLADEIFIDEKPPGYAIAGDHPRLTGEQFMAQMMSAGED